jgi:hypothetical protein
VSETALLPRCPVCGASSLTPEREMGSLLAVCDVLVVKALEQVGRRIVRDERSRFRTLGTRPWHVVHTIWSPADGEVTKILKGAWDVVPAMLDAHGCCGVTSVQVTAMLDDYVHDLVITGTFHTLTELNYRFDSRLGLPTREVVHAHV